MLNFRQWYGRPWFNSRSRHTKDSKKKKVLDAVLLNTQHSGHALMCDIQAKLSSAQSRASCHQNGCNVHDCIKLWRVFFQLSFLYILFSFNIFPITHFRVVLSF